MTFEGATTVAEINRCYKDAFASVVPNSPEYWSLSEAHRRALSEHTTTVAADRTARHSDPNRVMPKVIRKWATENKIPLAKGGRVTLELENTYRSEHGLEPKAPRIVSRRDSGAFVPN